MAQRPGLGPRSATSLKRASGRHARFSSLHAAEAALALAEAQRKVQAAYDAHQRDIEALRKSRNQSIDTLGHEVRGLERQKKNVPNGRLAEGEERDQKHSLLSSTPSGECCKGRDLSAGRGSPAGPYGA
jgi:hypothetical protein